MKFIITVAFILCLSSCSKDRHIIKVKGSDTEVNLAVLMAESFREQNDSIIISISGGGSGLGIASLLNGTADIANSSRSINEKEIALFDKKGIELEAFAFAQDAVAFVVSKEIDLDSISISSLSKILSGEVKNWKALTSQDIPITIYGRQNNSGTHEYVKHTLNIQFSPHAKQMNGNAQILEAIRTDNSGIGYVGAGYVMNDRNEALRVLKVYEAQQPAISPLNPAEIASGGYFFQRPLFQYYKKGSYEKVRPFLDFEKTTVGAEIIHSSGYYPINQKP